MWAYGAAGRLAEPLAGFFLSRRERRGMEDGRRRGERFGRGGCPRPAGPLVWVHATSIGETVAALPLIEVLTERGLSVVLTTNALAAAQVAETRLPPGAIHQYAPIDTPGSIDRFLDHWRPGLVLFAESELWPTTLKCLERRGLPLVLVSGRMSERSFRAWRRMEPLARAVLGRTAACLTQSAVDAERLRALGAGSVEICGNLKYDVAPPPADANAVDEMRARIGDRFVLLGASTRPGEEAAVLAAHAAVAGGGMDLLTILAPRHAWRGEPLAAEIADAGLRGKRRSQGEAIDPDTEIYLADTTGEMGLWYRVADVAFLGGSISPRGGQNPIEPAKLRIPVLHGPYVANFRDVYGALRSADAATCVEDGDALAAAVMLLCQDADARERLASRAYDCVERSSGALDRTVKALEPYLARLTPPS
ncbi:MAG: 3-deoxy-D-manno-octulosonic acid transferase [Rhizobiales bacterium]|nr:3-deoxy-D-manno-octulosonic acid transferase [Hyphomicrobiales bacterium]MDQ3559280.1 3-deoxy-D-manno-octulosonic acid transferase [Pseudomonadota bacterium]